MAAAIAAASLPVCALAQNATPEPLLLSTTPAPGISDGKFSNLLSAASNEAGDLVISTLVSGTGIDFSNDTAVYTLPRGASTPTLRFRENDTAPGTGGAQFSTGGYSEINAMGVMAFRINLKGANVTSANSDSIWTDEGTGPLLAARTSYPAPGGGTFSFFYGNRVPISDSGAIAFSAIVSGGTFSHAFYYGEPDNLKVIVKSGQPAPSLESLGATIDFVTDCTLSADDRYAVLGHLRIGANPPPHPGVILTGASDTEPTLFLREGTAVPGIPGVVFENFLAFGLNDTGEMAINAILGGSGISSTNEASIWTGAKGALRLIARGGQRAPGTEAGVVFDHFNGTGLLSIAPVINGNGRTAFLARLTGPGVTSSNNIGLWAEDGAGQLHLIVRGGDIFTIAGQSRPVTTIVLDLMRAYTISGELVFSVGVNSGQYYGIYRTEVSQAPAPAPTPAPLPTVLVSSRKHLVTDRSRITLRGSAENATRVEGKVGHGAFRKAASLSPWKFTARLVPGRNLIRIRAVSPSGITSPTVAIAITRRVSK